MGTKRCKIHTCNNTCVVIGQRYSSNGLVLRNKCIAITSSMTMKKQNELLIRQVYIPVVYS